MARKTVMQTLAGAAACGLAAYLVGKAVTNHYEACDRETKRQWDRERIMHHGELGCLALGAGILAKSPNLVSTGLGLMASDTQDSNKWFKPAH